MQIAKQISYYAPHLLISLCVIKIKVCACHESSGPYTSDISVVDFSVDDIFDSDLIPVKIISNQLNNFFNYIGKEQTSEWNCFSNSDLNTAVKGMIYHRHMMNAYLLSDYLSKEIIGSIPKTYNYSAAIEKRTGKAKNASYVESFNANSNTNSLPLNHKLIEDEGSSQYSNWLKRTNTFEDIKKQLLNERKHRSGHNNKSEASRRQSLSINFDRTYEEPDVDDGIDYLEDGDITGYAFTNNPTEQSVPIILHKTHQKSMPERKPVTLYKQAGNKVGYDNGYDDYSAPPHPVHNYASTALSKQTTEIGLKDITDIALTTLAFLSFGMFILQVLMCITMSKDDTSSMVMLPMEGTDSGDIPVDGNTEEIRRKRRSILSTQMQNIEVVDHLAKRALFSLNSVINMSKDGGACHYYSLCENNKFSKRLGDITKLWIPAWSLGISWLTTKFNISNKKGMTSRNANPVINSLKAVIIGLNNGDCSAHYIHKCKVLLKLNI